MKTYLALVLTLVSVSAFADNASQVNVNSELPVGTSEVVGYDAVLDQGPRPFAIEVGLQSIGDYGNQSEHTFSNGNNRSVNKYQSTNGTLSMTIRKAFSTNFDLSISGTILNSTPYSSDPADNDTTYTRVSIRPISIGARYHQSYFADSITPFVQVDLGEALVSESDYLTAGTSSEDTPLGTNDRNYLRTFAKVAIGSDFFIAPKTPLYLGVKLGYLVMSEFGGFTSGVDLGYAF
jgi:hypothetical protein